MIFRSAAGVPIKKKGQPRAAIFAALRIQHYWSLAKINLRLLTRAVAITAQARSVWIGGAYARKT